MALIRSKSMSSIHAWHTLTWFIFPIFAKKLSCGPNSFANICESFETRFESSLYINTGKSELHTTHFNYFLLWKALGKKEFSQYLVLFENLCQWIKNIWMNLCFKSEWVKSNLKIWFHFPVKLFKIRKNIKIQHFLPQIHLQIFIYALFDNIYIFLAKLYKMRKKHQNATFLLQKVLKIDIYIFLVIELWILVSSFWT